METSEKRKRLVAPATLHRRQAAALDKVGEALAAARAAERSLAAAVERGRQAGLTWAEIAAALGVSRQAVYQRFGAKK